MKVCIHRGTKQIGGSCIELEHAGARILLDVGLPLDGACDDRSLLPRLTAGIEGVVVSHPHLDHYGLLHHLPADTPVCIGAAARRIIRAAAPFTGQPLPALGGIDLQDRVPIQIGPFRITPYLVDHSAYDAYALLIEAGGKRLFYSGDFRGHGRKGELFERLLQHPPGEIDVLLMEGTTLSRLDEPYAFPSEHDLENELLGHLQVTEGLVMAYASAQNIDRIVTVYRACKRANRTLVIDLYTAAILEATGNAHIPQSFWPGVALFTPQRQRRQIVRLQAFELLKRHAVQRIYQDALSQLAASAVLLFRPLHMEDLQAAGVLAGARFIYSQWSGYLQEASSRPWRDWLQSRGIEMRHLHTSGHASPTDLQRFAKALAPASLVPIHSFASEQYPSQFDRVRFREDGEWWSV